MAKRKRESGGRGEGEGGWYTLKLKEVVNSSIRPKRGTFTRALVELSSKLYNYILIPLPLERRQRRAKIDFHSAFETNYQRRKIASILGQYELFELYSRAFFFIKFREIYIYRAHMKWLTRFLTPRYGLGARCN